MANICIVGLWHQGAVLSACLSDLGHKVCGVDEQQLVDSLSRGEPAVHEPQLGELLRRNLKARRLEFTSDYATALRGADYAYISIDTPVDASDRSNLETIFAAAQRIADSRTGNLTLVITAQVPIGTCRKLAALVSEKNPVSPVRVAYVPEFLRLGAAVETFRQADRFVVGCDDQATALGLAELYRPLNRPVVTTDLASAEMAKHASNAFLATSISFINEISDLCEELGADATEVAKIMKLDRRIGPYAFLSPGLGFAGGTLGRELRALQELGSRSKLKTAVVDAAVTVNDSRAGLIARKLVKHYGSLKGLQVAILGLTYKAGTSTLRRAISLEIIRQLNQGRATVTAFDPLARLDEVPNLPPFKMCADVYEAGSDSDALVLVTEWDGIDSVDFERLRNVTRRPLFIDSRNILDPEMLRKAGFSYSGIGR